MANFTVFDINPAGFMNSVTIQTIKLSLGTHDTSSEQWSNGELCTYGTFPELQKMLQKISKVRKNCFRRAIEPFVISSAASSEFLFRMSSFDAANRNQSTMADELDPEVLPSVDQIRQEIANFVEPLELIDTVIEKNNLIVTKAHLRSLYGNGQLVDDIVHFYFQMIADRSTTNGYPRILCQDPLFFTKALLTVANPENRKDLLKWNKKVRVFDMDLLLFPHNVNGNHWTLTVVNLKKKELVYYDSLGNETSGQTEMNIVLDFLNMYHEEKYQSSLVPDEWKCISADAKGGPVPKQNNGYDCGVFVCQYAEYISRRAPLTFTQVSDGYMMTQCLSNKFS